MMSRPYHKHFSARLRDLLGRVQGSGQPRLTRLGPGTSRFTLVNPNGNILIFVKKSEPNSLEYGGSPRLSGLAKALDNERILCNFREDDLSAFRALKLALRRPKPDDKREDRATALAWMIEHVPKADSSAHLSHLVRELRDRGLTGTERDDALRALSNPEGCTVFSTAIPDSTPPGALSQSSFPVIERGQIRHSAVRRAV